MPKVFLTVEDNRANVVGFRTEETVVDGQGKDRGDRVEFFELIPTKQFPRSGMAHVDPKSLAAPVELFPTYLGTKKGTSLKPVEQVREEIELFGKVEEEAEPVKPAPVGPQSISNQS